MKVLQYYPHEDRACIEVRQMLKHCLLDFHERASIERPDHGGTGLQSRAPENAISMLRTHVVTRGEHCLSFLPTTAGDYCSSQSGLWGATASRSTAAVSTAQVLCIPAGLPWRWRPRPPLSPLRSKDHVQKHGVFSSSEARLLHTVVCTEGAGTGEQRGVVPGSC